MKKHLCQSQQGSVAVITALFLPIILGGIGLALDMGNLVLNKTKLRNAVDAAAYAGALKLNSGHTQAQTEATSFLASNGFPSITPSVTFAQDAVRNPTNLPEINISVSHAIPTDFLGVFGYGSVTLNVSSKAVFTGIGPPFNYTLYSKQDLRMNGSETVRGSVHSDGVLNVNGSGVFNGNVEGVRGISMNGSEHVTGYAAADTVGDISIHGSEHIDGGIRGGADSVDMPDFTQAIIDATQTADKHTGSYTFNGSDTHGSSIYVQGDVVINGSVNWTGSILATGNITINGSSQISGSNQVFLYSQNGNITMNGSTSFGTATASCIAYAPCTTGSNGSITINGSSNWYGRVIGNILRINGSGNFDGSGASDITSLPSSVAGGHAKII